MKDTVLLDIGVMFFLDRMNQAENGHVTMATSGESTMSSRIYERTQWQTTEVVTQSSARLSEEASLLNKYEYIQQSFHYWRGASGKRYLHTIYSLLDCPILPKANYIMVCYNEDGNRTPLRIGKTVEEANSLNLAYLRKRGAQLGANEIHVHLLSDNPHDRMITEMDLRAGLFSHLGAENV